ncbi:hypothetical protein [Polymorphobacter sp.]|uniref:hypothetical protein n=1 Tax=Polymorphobacter sp. TaxID=1909290 RepID=UPI003F7074C5
MKTNMLLATILALETAMMPAASAAAQQSAAAATATEPSYAALVDLVLASPVIVRATVTRSQSISARNAPGLAAGQARLLVTADVVAALVAPAAIPPQLSWLVDVPLDARGRAPSLRGRTVMAWLEVPAADGKAQLATPAAQRDWNERLEARVRAIATEVKANAAPVITGVTNGFRVEGTLPGESESQFFLSTRNGKPLTMVVLERPGQSMQLSVASGDIIDESATSVKPETLLWYRLACGLPAQLPAASGGNDVALANAWIGALAGLGPCTR